ncbi:acetoacetate--CoA ligase [Candidatus Uabimicrobium amorphum]|uniref:Acetoacetyl-CoA synthetase n=1 Tax=Uabimicrobium amorphum TaxID=2596890 RepID=A0A5S9IKM3_UABAM|nr:acetoacetate--CoA ligase [Candidatus Uabimicrobium amorphum]BBM82335.1 acetoacetyl-CoA synthetase [Candidatus Uabimicrobium amorphum]
MQKPLWTPSAERVKNSNMQKFIDVLRQDGTEVGTYENLHQWSIEHLGKFWEKVWDFVEIRASKPFESALVQGEKMRDTKWFTGAKLNFAENLLRYRDDRIAIVFRGEDQVQRSISYKDLYASVAKLATALKDQGVQSGDRVAGFMPNMLETVVAMLATTSLGAVWSSCSPDFGMKGVLDRFGQIQPKVLFTANGYYYNGKQNDSLQRVQQVVEKLPSIEKVVVINYLPDNKEISHINNSVHYEDFVDNSAEELEFVQVPFDHPLYIMYSSGTTGLPKCMVQSVGGILINHLKELVLHVDVKREDVIFYYTTCGWMMWNWLVSSLATGATVLLYDGSPFFPEGDSLWKMAEKERITIFGTSARYLTALQQKVIHPKESANLSELKAILSTGSPLPEESFYFVHKHIKEDVHLASISGGTDLNGCFVGGNPLSAVFPGEIQGKCLGMDVVAYDSEGNEVTEQKGELVCRSPFPSMPIYFWNDEDGSRYTKAYFAVYEDTWRHGDYIEITQSNGVIIYGRSDATLNPGGVRIGTAEIYRQVEALEEIEDSVVVGQEWQNDTRVVLFVKMVEGKVLDETLCNSIKNTIRQNASIRHVPAKIIAVDDIPYTISMKKVEIAVREIIHGRPVYNQDALKNPESLELYKNISELQE